jgi:HEAT repeat protein
VCEKAKEALLKIGDEQMVAPLLKILCHEDSFAQLRAAETLSLISVELMSKGLFRAISQKRRVVRRKAAEVIGYYANSEQVWIELSRFAKTNSSKDVRCASRKALRKFERKRQYFDAPIPIAHRAD